MEQSSALENLRIVAEDRHRDFEVVVKRLDEAQPSTSSGSSNVETSILLEGKIADTARALMDVTEELKMHQQFKVTTTQFFADMSNRLDQWVETTQRQFVQFEGQLKDVAADRQASTDAESKKWCELKEDVRARESAFQAKETEAQKFLANVDFRIQTQTDETKRLN